jgi:hypothetical protein
VLIVYLIILFSFLVYVELLKSSTDRAQDMFVCYYIQLSIFSSLPVQAVYVYNPVNHTGSRLAHKI